MKTEKVWFITGASRGLGLAITEAVLQSGEKVVATVRTGASLLRERFKSENLFVAELDVTDAVQAKDVFEQGVAHFGKIDVLLNNAGFGLLSAVEEGSDDEIRKMFDTNVFGLLNVTRATLPYFRERRSGHIINVSSVGGLIGSAGWGLYNATKFAVEGLSEALAKELKPLGIDVTIVEPGYFRTNFLDGSSLTTSTNVIEDYKDTSGKMRGFAQQVSYNQPGDPVKLAQALVKVGMSEQPPLHLLLGKDTLFNFRNKLSALEKDIETWHDTTVGTDHDDVNQS